MIQFSRTDGPPDYKEFLRRHSGFIYMSDTIHDSVAYDKYVLSTLLNQTSEIMKMRTSDIYFNPTSRESVKNFLFQYCNVAANDITVNGIVGLNKKSLPNISKYPLASDFTELYMKYKSLQSKLSKLSNFLDIAEHTNKFDWFGRPLLKWPYKMSERSTGRIYASDINYQNIAKDYVSHICEEAGRCLISCDFAAFEVTIQYYLTYRTAELDEGFLLCDDPYEFMYYVMNPNGKEFTKELRNVWKTPYLAAVYNQHPSVTAKQLGDEELAKKLHAWLDNNPKRHNYLNKIVSQYDKKGHVTASTYWGRLLTSEGDEHSSKEAIKNRFANIPIQGTGHDIVTKYGLEVLRRLEKAGVPKKECYFLMSRHDEPVFSVPMEYIDVVHKVMEECTLVQVDDWRPFRVTAKFQPHYTETYLEVEPPKLSIDEIRNIQVAKSNYFCPIRDNQQLRVGHYITFDNDGEAVYVVYGYSMADGRIRAKIFKDYSTMRYAIDTLIYSVIVDSPNDDLEVITSIPIIPYLNNTLRLISEEGLNTDIKQTLSSSLVVDMNLITSIFNQANMLDKVLLPFKGHISDYVIEPITPPKGVE